MEEKQSPCSDHTRTIRGNLIVDGDASATTLKSSELDLMYHSGCSCTDDEETHVNSTMKILPPRTEKDSALVLPITNEEIRVNSFLVLSNPFTGETKWQPPFGASAGTKLILGEGHPSDGDRGVFGTFTLPFQDSNKTIPWPYYRITFAGPGGGGGRGGNGFPNPTAATGGGGGGAGGNGSIGKVLKFVSTQTPIAGAVITYERLFAGGKGATQGSPSESGPSVGTITFNGDIYHLVGGNGGRDGKQPIAPPDGGTIGLIIQGTAGGGGGGGGATFNGSTFPPGAGGGGVPPGSWGAFNTPGGDGGQSGSAPAGKGGSISLLGFLGGGGGGGSGGNSAIGAGGAGGNGYQVSDDRTVIDMPVAGSPGKTGCGGGGGGGGGQVSFGTPGFVEGANGGDGGPAYLQVEWSLTAF